MTKFVTYYNLCPIHDPKEFLGIAPDREDGNIITTVGKNIIVVIKISTQKQIRSWSVLEKLSSKVVFDQRSERYVGVFANRTIRCWAVNVSDVNKVKKLKFQRNIADLITAGEDTFVLYSNGTCELLANAIERRKEEFESAPHQNLDATHPNQPQLSKPNITKLPDGRQLLTYFVRQHNSEDLVMVRVPLETGGGAPKLFNLKRENLDVQVTGYAVIEGDDSPMLLTIWSDKRIFLLSLHDNVEPEKSPGNFVSMLSTLKVDSPMSVLGISRHFVAIYGANSGQEGASLLLYNTQFKLVKAKQFFKVYFDFSRLWTVDDNILLAMGQNLSVVTYRMSKDLLAELLGTQSKNDFQVPIEGDHINEEDFLQECLQYTNKAPAANDDNNAGFVEASEVFESAMADGKFIPYEAVYEFDNELRAVSHNRMHIEMVQDEHPLEDFSITPMSQCSDGLSLSGEVQLIARQLERCGASEHEITEKLLTVLIKAKLLQDIAVCLQRYSNVSEKILAKTLSFVLIQYVPPRRNAQPSLNGTAEPEENADTAYDGEDVGDFDILATKPRFTTCSAVEPSDVLDLVLSCSFDTVTMTDHVRRELDYAKVLLLLEHLYEVLTSEDAPATLVERPGCAAACVQTELQALRWFGVLLNAHFQQLALSKDLRLMDLLFKWHELFSQYKTEIAELEQLAALLYSIVQRKKISKEKNSSKWYSIEEVVLY